MPSFATCCRSSAAAIAACLSFGLTACNSTGSLEKPLPTVASTRSVAFRQAMGSQLGSGFIGGNRLTTLSNGGAIFPAMLQAIRGAKETINFETFVYYKGEIPNAFAESLMERARAGVKVNVILDAVGASKSAKYHRQMREAGVQLAIYHPLSWWEFYSYNYRTHRKLLVIDGRTGFIGGVGIADEWDGDARSPEEWRDLHYRVEGPAVAQLQGIFASNWFETRKEVLQGPGYFPGLRPVGPVAASVFAGAPQDRDYAVELMYQLAIASARKSIYIESPYFIPGRTMVESFRAAASRGVDVQILMPGDHIDQKSVQRASRKRWPKLLEAGVKLFEYEPTMIHSKLMIVDGNFVTIGSANFDPRSLSINDEANMNVLDEAFAAEQTRIFFRDRALSRPVDPQEYGVDGVVELPLQAVQTPLESQL